MRRVGQVIMGAMVVALMLLLMLGQFWVIYLAPLLIFIGVGVVYGFLSSKPRGKITRSGS